MAGAESADPTESDASPVDGGRRKPAGRGVTRRHSRVQRPCRGSLPRCSKGLMEVLNLVARLASSAALREA
jgi:hypothetical protein